MINSYRRPLRGFFRVCVVAMLMVWIPALAQAQATIKVNDNVNFRFGALLQSWADSQQDAATRDYTNNVFIRRIRILIGGQVTPNITFFFETDNPNLGKAPKSPGSGFLVQDAFVEWKPTGSKAFALGTGLMLVPLCRNCLVSAALLMPVDYGSFSFVENAATQSVVGRDTGVQARGFLLNERLEYRAALFQGFRRPASSGSPLSSNPLRKMVRLQYSFLEKEAGGFFYPGFYLANKRVATVGAAVDRQEDYRAYSADAFVSLPNAAKTNALNAELLLLGFDGGTTFTSIPEQRDVSAQAGYYIGSLKIQPFLRLERQDFRNSVNNGKDNNRIHAGLAWLPNGHNFNIKGAYTRVDPRVGDATNQFTVQLQFFYY